MNDGEEDEGREEKRNERKKGTEGIGNGRWVEVTLKRMRESSRETEEETRNRWGRNWKEREGVKMNGGKGREGAGGEADCLACRDASLLRGADSKCVACSSQTTAAPSREWEGVGGPVGCRMMGAEREVCLGGGWGWQSTESHPTEWRAAPHGSGRLPDIALGVAVLPSCPSDA